MNLTGKNRTSLYTGIVLFAIILFTFPWSGHWKVIAWDTFGYYLYLPEFFIWHDPGIRNYEPIHDIVQQYKISTMFYQVHDHESGNHIIQYPIGMALLMTIPFLIGHAVAWFTGMEMNGLSMPYEWSLLIFHFIVVGYSIWLFRKWMLRWFTDSITSILLVVLILGTNFWITASVSVWSPHMFLFPLYILFLLNVEKWYALPLKWSGAKIGFLLGLITLCRVSDFIIVLVPLLWNINGIKDMKERALDLYKGKYKQSVIMGTLAFLCVIFPQFLYWKTYTDQWFYNSYNNAGEGFDFLTPHIANFLFSFRKGWFVYTPVMLLLFYGFWVQYKSRSSFLWLCGIFLIADIYLLASWSCWYYAGSFSQRSLVEAYPIILLPVGTALTAMYSSTMSKKILLTLFIGCCIVLNLFQTWQSLNGVLHVSRTTPAYYFRVFGKVAVPPGADSLLLTRRGCEQFGDRIQDSSQYRIHTNIHLDGESVSAYFEKERSGHIGFNSSGSFYVTSRHPYSSTLKIPFNEFADGKDHAFIHVRFRYFCPKGVEVVKPTVVLSFNNRNDKAYDYNGVKLEDQYTNGIQNHWRYFDISYLSPEVRNESDPFTVYFWIRGNGALYVDDLDIRSFIRKD